MKLHLRPPTHEEISRQAHRRWQDEGCPAGRDLEIWLEAEQTLAAARPEETFAVTASAETAAESAVEYHLSPAMPEAEAVKAALMKAEARAPQEPHHTGPKAKPPESGKPLWNQPHSR
jgi:hypothetical protein